LWLLSRSPQMPDDVKTGFLQQASAIGYNVSRLQWTLQQQETIF
jgi:lipocalin